MFYFGHAFSECTYLSNCTSEHGLMTRNLGNPGWKGAFGVSQLYW
jgi:hypothetical protein